MGRQQQKKAHKDRSPGPSNSRSQTLEVQTRILTLVEESEDLTRHSLKTRTLLGALSGNLPDENSSLKYYTELLRKTYSEEALGKLAEELSLELQENSNRQKSLHDRSVHLMNMLAAFTTMPQFHKILTEGKDIEEMRKNASTAEILACLQTNSECYLSAIHEYSIIQKVENKLSARVQKFLLACPPELMKIISEADKNDSAIDDLSIKKIICLAPWRILDTLPSEDILAVISQRPDLASAAIKRASEIRKELYAELSSVLTISLANGNTPEIIPSPEHIEALRNLSSSYPADSWKKAMQKVGFITAANCHVDTLRSFLDSPVHKYPYNKIVLPERYTDMRPGDHICEDFDERLKSIAASNWHGMLPDAYYNELRSTRNQIHKELSLPKGQRGSLFSPGLLTDIIIFGFYRFGAFDIRYTLGDVYDTLVENSVIDLDFDTFSTRLWKTTFGCQNTLFGCSYSESADRHGYVQYSPCWDYPLNSFLFRKAEKEIANGARDGNVLCQKLEASRYTIECADSLSIFCLSSLHFFSHLSSALSDRTFDHSLIREIPYRPESQKFILGDRPLSTDYIQDMTCTIFRETFRILDSADTKSKDEWVDWLPALGQNATELWEATLSELNTFKEKLGPSDLAAYLRSLNFFDKNRELKYSLPDLLKAFSTFYSEHSGYIEETNKRVETLLSEIRNWRTQNDHL